MKKIIKKMKENRKIGKEFNDRMKEKYRLEVEEGIEPTFDDPKDERNYKIMKGTWNRNKFQAGNLKFIFVILLSMMLSGLFHYVIVMLLNIPILLILLIILSFAISIYLALKRKSFENNISVYFLFGILFSSFSIGLIFSEMEPSPFKTLITNILIIITISAILYSIYINHMYSEEKIKRNKEQNND